MTLNELETAMKENTPVYYVNSEALNITKCQIKAYSDTSSILCLILTSDCNDEIYAGCDDIFLNIDEAKTRLECAKQFKVSQYCSKIKDINDLSRFPYKYELYELDYNNAEDICIIEAYVKMAKKLLNIEM